MRIIGGEARGRVIRLPDGIAIRPTSDRVKASLFNILRSVEGSAFLDLFAGSGNVGLEALSRGAGFVAFVEKETRLVRALQRNVTTFGFSARAVFVAAEARKGLGRLIEQGHRFDILFIDPPYDRGWAAESLGWPETRRALAKGGTIVLQHSAKEDPEGSSRQHWEIADRRRYGETLLSFYQTSRETVDEKDSGIPGFV